MSPCAAGVAAASHALNSLYSEDDGFEEENCENIKNNSVYSSSIKSISLEENQHNADNSDN